MRNELTILKVLTHLTPGARAASGIEANPEALTADACIRPSRTLWPKGIASKALLPISKTRKKNQSVKLDVVLEVT